MIDLDAKIRSLAERNIPRKDIVSELDAIASDAESRAKPSKGTRHRGAANAASALLPYRRRGSRAYRTNSSSRIIGREMPTPAP